MTTQAATPTYTKTVAEEIVEEIIFKTKLIELTNREIESLRDELNSTTAQPAPAKPFVPSIVHNIEPTSAPAEPTKLHLNFEPKTAKETPAKEVRAKEFYNELPGEKWRPIAGYEKLYDISNKGRVRSLPRRVRIKGGNVRDTNLRILSGHRNGRGLAYNTVGLTKDMTLTSFTITTLMRNTWPEITNYQQTFTDAD